MQVYGKLACPFKISTHHANNRPFKYGRKTKQQPNGNQHKSMTMASNEEMILLSTSKSHFTGSPRLKKTRQCFAEVSPLSPEVHAPLSNLQDLQCKETGTNKCNPAPPKPDLTIATSKSPKRLLRQTYGSKKVIASFPSTGRTSIPTDPFSAEKLKMPPLKRKRQKDKKCEALHLRRGIKMPLCSNEERPKSKRSSKEIPDGVSSKLQKLSEFFSSLDTQRLPKAQASGRPEEDYIPGRPAVRTKRKGGLKYLSDSYKEYQKALCGVTSPIPFEDFARNHLLFSASGHLYDGILDV